MAKTIVSSKFIKAPSSKNIGRLIKYYATREGVEKIAKGVDNSKATKRQQDLILKAMETAPESLNYPELKEYFDNPTRTNASEFLEVFFERNEDKIDGVKKLMKYYAERPSVEKLGAHGLFSQTDDKIDLDKVAEEVANHKGIVWTHVVSLKREDAERLGYNNAKAWRELVRRNIYEIAEAHKIEPSDLRWYGAFHNTTHHPHMHLVVYSKSGRGYLTERGILKLKSAFGNDVFRNEQYKLFELQTELRDELRDEVKEYLKKLVDDAADFTPTPEATELFHKLQEQLKTVKGKKVYGYLPVNVKQTVDDLVREIAKDENISKLNSEWNRINREKLSLYHDKETPDIPVVENKEFRHIKNTVIQMAEYSSEISSFVATDLADSIEKSYRKKYETLRGQYSGESDSFDYNLTSLLRAAAIITDINDEDEEERRKRIEAEENANAIGTLLGTGIGLVSEIFGSDRYEEDDFDDEEEDIGFDLSM